MDAKERVLKAFNHEEADRVPIDLMGNASMLLDPTYLKLRDYFELSPIAPVRSGTTANYYDQRILEKLDIDFRRIFLKKSAQNQLTYHADESFSDVWGVTYKKFGTLVNIIHYPLSQASSVKDIDCYSWPQVENMFSVDDLADEATCRTQITVVSPGGLQVPGDCNQDGALDISDAVCTFGVLFTGSPEFFPCGTGVPGDEGNVSLMDFNSDSVVDISDGISALNFLFGPGAPHPLAVPGQETTGCVPIAGCDDSAPCLK